MTNSYEHSLYSMMEERLGKGAHAAYNDLISRISSFSDCFESYARRHPEGAASLLKEQGDV